MRPGNNVVRYARRRQVIAVATRRRRRSLQAVSVNALFIEVVVIAASKFVYYWSFVRMTSRDGRRWNERCLRGPLDRERSLPRPSSSSSAAATTAAALPFRVHPSVVFHAPRLVVFFRLPKKSLPTQPFVIWAPSFLRSKVRKRALGFKKKKSQLLYRIGARSVCFVACVRNTRRCGSHFDFFFIVPLQSIRFDYSIVSTRFNRFVFQTLFSVLFVFEMSNGTLTVVHWNASMRLIILCGPQHVRSYNLLPTYSDVAVLWHWYNSSRGLAWPSRGVYFPFFVFQIICIINYLCMCMKNNLKPVFLVSTIQSNFKRN